MSDIMSTGTSYSTGGTSGSGGQGELIKDTTTQDFAVDVIEESNNQPVLIDFWAPWCGPCKQLTPIIEKAVNDAKGAVKLVKMNIDEHPEISGQMGVKSIPAVVAFSNGRPVDGFMGAQGEKEIKEFIERIAPDPLPQTMRNYWLKKPKNYWKRKISKGRLDISAPPFKLTKPI